MRSLKAAAIQVKNRNGQPDKNLESAANLVREAARQGAKLALCPEFLAAGYLYDESLWEAGEPRGGPTETFLARAAKEHGILIGATFLEAEGEEFFNTFSLFGPEGVLGRVRKGSLPFFEGWYFAPCEKPKVIQTDLGKIGVGICNDTNTAAFLKHMFDEKPDLILMPHSAPTPRVPLLDPLFRPSYRKQLKGIASKYAQALGVPVVFANKVSEEYRTPLPLAPGLSLPFEFEGFSAICDAEGKTLAYSEGEEKALVAEIVLDPGKKHGDVPATSGYWSFAPSFFPRVYGAAFTLLDRLGRRAYRQNPRRAGKARAAGSK